MQALFSLFRPASAVPPVQHTVYCHSLPQRSISLLPFRYRP